MAAPQGHSAMNRQVCIVDNCREPQTWKSIPDRACNELHAHHWEKDALADLKEIRANVGLLGDVGVNGPHGNVALMSMEYKHQADERDWYFKKQAPPVPQRIFSNYCKAHTCRYFFSRQGCEYQKPIYDSVCNEHACCPLYGSLGIECDQAKGQFKDVTHNIPRSCKFLRHEFCTDHKCSVPDCELLRDELQPNKFGQFCPRHRCYYKNCILKSIDKGGFCAKHKCSFRPCQKISVDGYELCKKHVECDLRTCSSPRLLLPENCNVSDRDRADCGVEVYNRKIYMAFCKEHATCSEASCSGFRLKGASHCRKHACIERGCQNGFRDRSKYCATHRCEMPGCHNAKTWNDGFLTRESFCPAHLCRDGDCSNGCEDFHLYCEEHECSNPDCVNPLSGNGLCHEHAILKNTKDTKAAARTDAEAWARILRAPDAGSYYVDRLMSPPLPPTPQQLAFRPHARSRSRSPRRHYSRSRSRDTPSSAGSVVGDGGGGGGPPLPRGPPGGGSGLRPGGPGPGPGGINLPPGASGGGQPRDAGASRPVVFTSPPGPGRGDAGWTERP